jgi:hypothetical protein
MKDWLKDVCELREQVRIGLQALPCRVLASFSAFNLLLALFVLAGSLESGRRAQGKVSQDRGRVK